MIIGIICWYCSCILLKGTRIMPTRSVVLADRQTTLIKQLISSGRYQNASEVLREGIRLIEYQELENEARLTALREAARTGIADMESGHFKSFDASDPIRRHLSALAGDTVGSPSGGPNDEG